ncbi:hypothetical protein D3C71_1529500 [compost metagenome]
MPIDCVCGRGDFTHRLGQGLSMLSGEGEGNIFCALTNQACGFMHNRCAIECRDLLPGGEPFFRSDRRIFNVSQASFRNESDLLFSCRIDYGDRFSGMRVTPYTANKQWYLFHDHLS